MVQNFPSRKGDLISEINEKEYNSKPLLREAAPTS